MSTLLKRIITFILAVIFILLAFYFYNAQNTTTLSTDEVEFIKDNIAVGNIRSEINEQGYLSKENSNKVSKDELIANLVSDLALEYKNLPYDISVQYVFYDDRNEVTKVDKDINSMLFWVEYVDENGKLKTSTKKKVVLNKLVN